MFPLTYTQNKPLRRSGDRNAGRNVACKVPEAGAQDAAVDRTLRQCQAISRGHAGVGPEAAMSYITNLDQLRLCVTFTPLLLLIVCHV